MNTSAMTSAKSTPNYMVILFRVIVIVCFAGLLINYIVTVVDGLTVDTVYAVDFQGYYVAAKALTNNENPYEAYVAIQSDRFSQKYRYPPTFATALIPLAYQSDVTAQRVWLLATQVFFGIGMLLSIAICKRRFSKWQLLLIGIVALGFYPVYTNMKLGNVSMLLFAIVALTYWLWQRGNRTLAAFALALGISLKLFPGLILLYLLWKKEYRLAFLSALFTALLIAIPDLLVGQPLLVTYIGYFFEATNTGSLDPAWIDNQSIYGFFLRLIQMLTQTDTLSPLASILRFILAGGAVLGIMVLSPRDRKPSDPMTILEVGLVLFLFPLFNSRSFTHYYVWILLIAPVLVYLLWNMVGIDPRPRSYVLAAASLVAFLFMSQPFRIARILGYNVEVETLTLNGFGVLLQSLLLYGAVIIVIVVSYLLYSSRDQRSSTITAAGAQKYSPETG